MYTYRHKIFSFAELYQMGNHSVFTLNIILLVIIVEKFIYIFCKEVSLAFVTFIAKYFVFKCLLLLL